MSKKRAIIALNGIPAAAKKEYQHFLDIEHSLVIGADGGALFLEEIGCKADLIIGDLDSLPAAKVSEYQQLGIKLLQYPLEKDQTDGELALQFCIENGLEEVVIIGASGGRIDQQLANIFLLEYAVRHQLTAMIREPGLEIGIIMGKKEFLNKKGRGLSLIPLDERISDVSISGCQYRLNREELTRYKTRGISNRIVTERAVVEIADGLLLYLLTD